jgi:hypothetical protein
MNGKNSAPQCTSRYCPVNTSADTEMVVTRKTKPVQTEEQAPADALASKPMIDMGKRQMQVDQALLNRNRELRKQLDERRALEMDKDYRGTIVNGAPEAAKMRLLLMLGKFQTLQVEYAFLSEYFDSCLKKMDQSNYDVSVIKESVVFDRDDLKSSATCYSTALANVKKLKSMNLAAVSDIVDGLSVVLKDLQ